MPGGAGLFQLHSQRQRSTAALLSAGCTALIVAAIVIAGRIGSLPERSADDPIALSFPVEPRTEPPPRQVPNPPATTRSPGSGLTGALAPPTPLTPVPVAPDAVPVPAVASEGSVLTPPGDGGVGAASGTGIGNGGSGSGFGTPTPKTEFFTARWVREPSPYELAPYFPRRGYRERVSGRATIACNVRRSQRVRNCRLLSESPAGYGFGAAILSASRIFRVYPPMRDGVALEEAWVAITIDMAMR